MADCLYPEKTHTDNACCQLKKPYRSRTHCVLNNHLANVFVQDLVEPSWCQYLYYYSANDLQESLSSFLHSLLNAGKQNYTITISYKEMKLPQYPTFCLNNNNLIFRVLQDNPLLAYKCMRLMANLYSSAFSAFPHTAWLWASPIRVWSASRLAAPLGLC